MEERFRMAGAIARTEYEYQIDEAVRGMREPLDFDDVDGILDEAQKMADIEDEYRKQERKNAALRASQNSDV